MKKKSFYNEDNIMRTLTSLLIWLFKWICFCSFVIVAGLTIGLLAMFILRGDDLANTFIARMFSYISGYSYTGVLDLINAHGRINVITAICGYGFAVSLTSCVLYIITSKFATLFKSIFEGDVFSKENTKLVNDIFPLTFYVAFTTPILVLCISYSTHIFDYNQINLNGIVYVIIAYVLKLVFTNGSELQRKNSKYTKELADIKVNQTETKITKLKEEAKKGKKK